MHDLEVYQCVLCGTGSLAQAGDPQGPSVVCTSCKAEYPLPHNILDSMIRPDPEVVHELQGMATEQGLPAEQWNSVRIRRVGCIPPFEARLKESIGQPVEYYLQTKEHFEQALRHLEGFTPRRVLEVGSEADYFFLKHFRDRGAACHAVNISFQHEEPDQFLEWPEKALADMNRLPFKDGVFDLVLFSATLHHSPDLNATMREVARVCHSGGTVVVVSEQIGGWFKRSDRYSYRNEMVNETYRSFREYHSSFKRVGLEPEYLFSDHFSRKLEERRIHPQARFARTGHVLAYFWKSQKVQQVARGPLLKLAHMFFGFPLNVVLRKHNASTPSA